MESHCFGHSRVGKRRMLLKRSVSIRDLNVADFEIESILTRVSSECIQPDIAFLVRFIFFEFSRQIKEFKPNLNLLLAHENQAVALILNFFVDIILLDSLNGLRNTALLQGHFN